MACIDDTEVLSFQTSENDNPEATADTTASFHFVPVKIIDICVTQDGQRSYLVRWKDSWLTEELLALTYQNLINEFWETATCTTTKTVQNEDTNNKKSPKAEIVKIISNKQGDFDDRYCSIAPQLQPASVTVASNTNVQLDGLHVQQVSIGEEAPAVHMMDEGTILKSHPTVLPKLHNNSLASIVVNNTEVTLSDGLQYEEIHTNVMGQSYQQEEPAPAAPVVLPKYQQALRQAIAVQQPPLEQNRETGKTMFPKHVFSQVRIASKKVVSEVSSVGDTSASRVSCDICSKSLKTKKMLWAHKVAVHYGGNFPCEVCGKKCITAAELRRHKTSHSAERQYVCRYCGLAYKRWSHLYQHIKVHEDEKNFRCDVCHINFKVQSELKDHCFAEHTSGELVQCSVCKHKLQTPLAVYHHSMKHTGTRDFPCEICGSNFKRKQHLVTHMKTHLTEKKTSDGSFEAYECQACNERFDLKMELKAHCEAVHALQDSQESVVCKTCNRKLKLSHSVYLHGLRHCGSREFQCSDCGQLFKRKAHLLRHKMDRHPDIPRQRKKRTISSESIICSLCRKSFKYKTSLIKHMANQHGILPKAEDNASDYGIVYRQKLKKSHQCEGCSKRFKSQISLRKHKFKDLCGSTTSVNSSKIDEENEGTDRIVPQSTDHINTSLTLDMDEDSRATMVSSTSVHEGDPVSDMDGNTCKVSVAENTIYSSASQTTPQHVLGASSSVLGMSPDATSTITSSEILLSVEPVDSEESLQPHPQPHNDMHQQQVITVDETTGQIYLLRTINSDGVGIHGEDQIDNMGKIIHLQNEEGNHRGQIDVGQVISVQGSGDNVTFTSNADTYTNSSDSYEGQVINTNAIIQHQQQPPDLQMSIEQLGNEISLGQVLNQDGVAVSSVPLESLQALANEHNIIDFTQTSNEQIVVLLSALSGQSMQQM